MGIIALLLAILLPAMSGGRSAANDIKCRANTRSILIEFAQFADESGAGLRPGAPSWGERFKLEDFQERIYGIDESWSGPEVERQQLSPGEQLMMCPAGPAYLERRPSMPCSAGAIGPQRNVSMAFNRRLHKGSHPTSDGLPTLFNVYLTSKILLSPDVPLVLDASGEAALEQGVAPYYLAAPVQSPDGDDAYSSGQFWFPSDRHRGRTNVGYIGGHVTSSNAPLVEPWTQWGYQPN